MRATPGISMSEAGPPSLSTLLPLWSPLTTWERAHGPAYRDLWSMLPPVVGVHRTSLIERTGGKQRASCAALKEVREDAVGIVWSGIAVAFRHIFDHAGCGHLVDRLHHDKSFVIAFEPPFTPDANCPHMKQSKQGAQYITVPYPTQFHATSDDAIRQRAAAPCGLFWWSPWKTGASTHTVARRVPFTQPAMCRPLG